MSLSTPNDWSAVDWNKLEEDWSDGDDPELLKNEDEALQAEMEKKKAELEEEGAPNMRRLARMDPQQAKQAVANADAGNQGGPTMMFVDLKSNMGQSGVNTDGSDRTWFEEDLNFISQQWKDLLKTAGFDATLYNIEGDRLLVSVQKGWHGMDIRNFFLTRPEVTMLTWNGVETMAQDYVEV
ncbi:hypothetical protein TL16_g08644 [Triparma laevis f. inornata]|uniref:Uncharacterized protein n=1 Tax=Triparma laevis f. inornata TaxID=1714386 RepID=A0A9W7B221_9STRA|nr:hypothetical protein TL16_g08644 [Triparma laevis f. inornata]